ncbi:MAG: transglycosylase domain-containing protein [Gammaproteobacteria bacterium]
MLTACIVLLVATFNALHTAPESLAAPLAQSDKIRLLDRRGEPLSITYQNVWNVHDQIALHEIPAFLRAAFIQAEDRHFYRHHGQDWQARLHAVLQNIGGLRTVRGASTITEQVVRMLYPRPRTLWSKWLEGWEAERLEQRFSKAALLQFYLNQIPYAAQRRGIVQASRYYFDRDLETLSKKEMLALAVLVRAPSRLDIYRHPQAVEEPLRRLAEQMHARQLLNDAELAALRQEPFNLARPALDVEARHFVRYVLQQKLPSAIQVHTTLDAPLQAELQGVLEQQLQNLRSRHVANGGLLVADHQSGEVLAWVVAGAGDADKPAAAIDTITAPRQPGSSMKPFLYAQALEKGWTAATLIEDAPLTEMIGQGLHRYHNYSRVFYGQVSIREALGNSLNIPALKAIQYVGVEAYLALLKSLGFRHLTQHPNVYGDGLALGNAEVSLFEMVQAYATLANRGVFRPLRVLKNAQPKSARRVFSEPLASLLGNILSDPDARQLEFGSGTVLNLPVQTAVKTGTSSDFRDSWVFGYNDRHVVGAWMGNLDNTATDGVTGSSGPALVLRSAFALLNRQRETRPLYLSPQLLQKTVCKSTGRLLEMNATCSTARNEYFVPGHLPEKPPQETLPVIVRLRQPLEGLQVAVDPRVPLNKQALEFIMQGVADSDAIEWRVDGNSLGVHQGGRYLWPLRRGKHVLQAQVARGGNAFYQSPQVAYWVK